jgi:condensin complex subunit 3
VETPSTRLVASIVSLVSPLLNAKDKTVRFRATQLIAHIINTLDSIDDDTFMLLRAGLLKRLRDKESNIRVQAVLGLGRMANGGDEEEDEEDSDDDVAGGVLEKLLDVLQNDPSAEVRRTLLANLPPTPETLPRLLERARDLDAPTRRALYARVLPNLGDFRHLSLTFREKLLRWGLRDRDENVQKAAARLFHKRWIEDCVRSQLPTEDGSAPQPDQFLPPNMDALCELLERIDVGISGAEGGFASEAMKEFWEGRPDYREAVTFNTDEFWSQLSAESAFVARTFNDYCRSSDKNQLQDLIDEKMPVVTRFAFYIREHLNALLELVERVQQGDEEVEEDCVSQEFSVEQMLHIALTVDYSDDFGRKQMFGIMREALAQPSLPEECTKLVVEVLRIVSSDEREFCGIVLEAVADIHDTISDSAAVEGDEADDSFHSAQSELSRDSTPTRDTKIKSKTLKGGVTEDSEEVDEEKALKEIMVNLKCLHIAQCMLSNVQCQLEQNSDLVTMLNSLVVPAVRSQEAPIRERGLICLGLCCLLSKVRT